MVMFAPPIAGDYYTTQCLLWVESRHQRRTFKRRAPIQTATVNAATATRIPTLRSQAAVVVGQGYSASCGRQSSQTPAITNAAITHATTQVQVAKAIAVTRDTRFMQRACQQSLMSAMGGKQTLGL